MARARDIEYGETIFVGDIEVTRATEELYQECWGKSLPKGKVAFYSILQSEEDDFQFEWYLIPGNEKAVDQ